MPFKPNKYICVYNANHELQAVFVDDSQELMPTQAIAMREYREQHSSEFGCVVEYKNFRDIQEILD